MAWSAAGGKEGLEEDSGFVREDAGDDFDAMVETRMGEDFETRADRAALGVVGTVHEALDAGLDHRASTHGAGFECDVERGVGKAVVCECMGGFAKHDNFGVGSGVVIADGAVAGASNDFVSVNENGADRDFAGIGGSKCFVEREPHVIEIAEHSRRKE